MNDVMQKARCRFAPARQLSFDARSALLLATFLLAMLLACLGTPAQAWGKSYECPSVNITAQAQTDGSLHVVEQRTFSFDGDFSAVWWEFKDLPANAELEVASVRMAQVDDEGNVTGDWQALEPTSFQISWREEGGPGHDAWSLDVAQNTLYAFFSQEDTRVVFEIDYAIENGVQAYDDIAEVYWKYVPEGWEVDSDDVHMVIELPVPAGTTVTPGENVRAWGHGPTNGTLSVNDDGTVAYEVARVRSGQYAEARVVFPVTWLTNLDAKARAGNQGTMRLGTVLAEEQAWSDTSSSQAMISLRLIIGAAVACALVLLVAVIAFMRFGREYKPDFLDKYWRDVPERDVQPAVVGRLWRWNHESADDLAATILSLANKGVLGIEGGEYPDRKNRMKPDFCLVRRRPDEPLPDDPVERATIELLFEKVSEGEQRLWLGALREYATRYPQKYVDAMNAWQATLTGEVNKHAFFEKSSYTARKVTFAAAIVVLVAGLLVAAIAKQPPIAAFVIPTSIALAVLGNYMPRRTEYGNNIAARAKALRNWLRDAQTCNDFPPANIDATGELMVYGYLFGVADKAARALGDAIPSQGVAEEFAGANYLPWYAWYATGVMVSGNATSAASPGASLSDSLGGSVSSAFDGARTAVYNNAQSASGGVFGGGGSFTVGGGGGFGGGGGAR